jgi:hypothetical protein
LDFASLANVLLGLLIPVLVFAAILLSVVRLLNAVEDSAKTLRRIERLLREQREQPPE